MTSRQLDLSFFFFLIYVSAVKLCPPLTSLQCRDPELLRVRELHRRLAIRPAGGHEVQLPASQSHFPGAAAAAAAGACITACRMLGMRSIFLNFSFPLCYFSFLCLMFVGYKQGAQQASWIHGGYQNPQQAGWQWSRHVPHH